MLSDKDKKLARAKFKTLEEVLKQILKKLDALGLKLKQMGEEEIANLF